MAETPEQVALNVRLEQLRSTLARARSGGVLMNVVIDDWLEVVGAHLAFIGKMVNSDLTKIHPRTIDAEGNVFDTSYDSNGVATTVRVGWQQPCAEHDAPDGICRRCGQNAEPNTKAIETPDFEQIANEIIAAMVIERNRIDERKSAEPPEIDTPRRIVGMGPLPIVVMNYLRELWNARGAADLDAVQNEWPRYESPSLVYHVEDPIKKLNR